MKINHKKRIAFTKYHATPQMPAHFAPSGPERYVSAAEKQANLAKAWSTPPKTTTTIITRGGDTKQAAMTSALSAAGPEGMAISTILNKKKISGLPGKVFGGAKKDIGTVSDSLRKTASDNLGQAAELLTGAEGAFAVLKPMFWVLKLGQFAMTIWYPLAITALIFGVLIMSVLYGAISAYYGLFFLKCIPVVIVNMFLMIGNAVWFAVNGVYTLVFNGVIEVINRLFYYVLEPIYQSINYLAKSATFNAWSPDWHYNGIGNDRAIYIQPNQAFCYLRPDPIKPNADWVKTAMSFFAFSFVRAGEPLYMYDTNGTLVQDVYLEQNGAELSYYRINPDAIAGGIWDDRTHGSREWAIQYVFAKPQLYGWEWVGNGFNSIDPKGKGIYGMLFEPPKGSIWENMLEKIVSGAVDRATNYITGWGNVVSCWNSGDYAGAVGHVFQGIERTINPLYWFFGWG